MSAIVQLPGACPNCGRHYRWDNDRGVALDCVCKSEPRRSADNGVSTSYGGPVDCACGPDDQCPRRRQEKKS